MSYIQQYIKLLNLKAISATGFYRTGYIKFIYLYTYLLSISIIVIKLLRLYNNGFREDETEATLRICKLSSSYLIENHLLIKYITTKEVEVKPNVA